MRLHPIPAGLRFTHPAVLTASFFGSGLLRPASGSWGSLAALPFGLLIAWQAGSFSPYALLGAAALAYALGFWACTIWLHHSEDTSSRHLDPSAIVIDEVAGLWLALAASPMTVSGIVVTFILFRFFDIIKPWPASWADKKLTGGHGIMLDDIFAGGWTALVVLAAIRSGYL